MPWSWCGPGVVEVPALELERGALAGHLHTDCPNFARISQSTRLLEGLPFISSFSRRNQGGRQGRVRETSTQITLKPILWLLEAPAVQENSRPMPLQQQGDRNQRVERQQALRVRRLLVSVAVYAPCSAFLALVAWLGYLPAGFVPLWTATFAAANLVFFALIRTSTNLRFVDPSMTMVQMAVAITAVAMVLYHAEAARGALLMLLLVILFFGVLQLKTVEVLLMGALCSAAYGAVIVLLSVNRPGKVNVELEWVQWIALTATLAVLCPFVGYLGNIRRRLGESLRTIQELAHHDALTGLFNRHHLAHTLEREVARCARGTPPFLLVVMDIDHFKRINDTHGHLVGDSVLQAVAKQLQDTLRKDDYLARFGGEEFVLLMMANSLAAAQTSCDRLRKCVEELRIDALGPQRVTVSIGGSFYRPQDSQGSLLERADNAMYRAKTNGRNRTELAT